jgi:hypothetical protein
MDELCFVISVKGFGRPNTGNNDDYRDYDAKM